ncbi:hypothetical protein D1007_32445 [Hordeum vulgare]|nr:hypothetical protein D1007_32445 [Hordeum vulgare]
MKLLTDGLADIDHAVSETDLTTQFLHGLDKRLDTIRVVLGDQELPFDTVLPRVVLAEESQAQRAAEENASAFAFPGGDRTPTSGSVSGARGSTERAPSTGLAGSLLLRLPTRTAPPSSSDRRPWSRRW